LENGVHVFIEKPFTVTVRAALRVIEKAEEKGLSLGVAENLRYMEGTRAAGWLLQSGLLGRLQMVVSGGVGSVWSPDQIVGKTAWRHIKREAGGGGTMDIGAHLFDRIRYLCGEIEEVSALARTMEPRRFLRDEVGRVVEQVECEVDDTFFALLTFQSGAIGNIIFSWAGHGEPTELQGGMTIYGERGCVKGGRLILDGKEPVDTSSLFREKVDPTLRDRFFPHGVQNAFALELHEFLTAIAEGRQPETSGVEGMKDIAPGLAILESSALGRPVRLEDVESCRIETYQREINEYFGVE
jgi:predicted dehydrogenase